MLTYFTDVRASLRLQELIKIPFRKMPFNVFKISKWSSLPLNSLVLGLLSQLEYSAGMLNALWLAVLVVFDAVD